MSFNQITKIISILSVIIMLVWGFAFNGWARSWLAVVIGGLIIAILKVVYDKHYDMMVLNPGACGVEGFHLVRTALRFRIEDGKLKDMEVGEWPKFTKS